MTFASASVRTWKSEPFVRTLTVTAGIILLTGSAGLAGALALSVAVGALACGALGWLLSETLRPTVSIPSPDSLAAFPECCREIVSGLLAITSNPDPAFQDLMQARLAFLSEQVRDWSQGRLQFSGTEAWRTAYETVLTAPDISEYRSVAWLKSGEYWQDLPGKQGMQLNFELVDRGVRIERLLILGWNLWPPELRVPHASIRRWIDEQHYRGVWVMLVRECDLVTEQDLLRDIGIYGDRAVGELHSDDCSRTVSFTLSFDPAAVRLAHEHWARLKLFARPYAELVERAPGPGSAV